MENYVVVVEGLRDLGFNKNLKRSIQVAAAQAVNKTLDRTRTESARRILAQVNLSPSDVSPRSGRLAVAKRASAGDPEGIIRARKRSTSLARYVVGSPTRGQPVSVSIKRGGALAHFGRRAFLIRLRGGGGDRDSRGNLGLALRLRPGERVTGKHKMTRLDAGLYLLYGPSVDQIFLTVRDDVSPDALRFLEKEFLRLVDLEF